MKKLHKIGIVSAANVFGVLGSLAGVVKVILLPLFAVIAAGNVGDVDAVAKTIGTTASENIPDIITFGAVGWLGGAAWAYLINLSLKITKGLQWECK
jgi:hypothetical protein